MCDKILPTPFLFLQMSCFVLFIWFGVFVVVVIGFVLFGFVVGFFC